MKKYHCDFCDSVEKVDCVEISPNQSIKYIDICFCCLANIFRKYVAMVENWESDLK